MQVEWAFEDAWDVQQFHEEVPSLALEFPFELDPFQKRAVRRVERSEHVMVAAHTSAGKTVVAEYAVAHALQHGMRTIYTSPIKALSNQKFQEFSRRFAGLGSVGIVTGDVAVNPEASCVIMTTEILRSMLYRSDKALREVKWVIFDEVHYVNDAERGVVWEEVIILLPREVSIVMLSATVPNYKDFAGWVGRTKQRPVYSVHTSYRPTPLRHFLSFRGHTLPLMDDTGFHLEAFQRAKELQNEKVKVPPRKRLVSVTFESRPFGMSPSKDEGQTLGYLVDKVNHNDPSKPAARLGVKPGWIVTSVAGEDVEGRSLEDVQLLTKQASLPVTIEFEVPVVCKEKEISPEKSQPKMQLRPPQSRESRERTETLRLQALLRTLELEDQLPATVFIFSRRRVEALAAEMPHLDVQSERSQVHIFLKKAFQHLSEADKTLPQVLKVEELASRGVGIHHGGMLPVVKEAVEIMFSRGLVKILLATETFAMGVNMPARSVVFTSWMKHDGNQRRALLPSEYTQMAGRAGRRGLDNEGHVYILCADEPPDAKQISRMMTSKGEPLFSRFRVTFAMILQMKRFAQSGVQVEDLLGQSFLENARARRRPKAQEDREHRLLQLEAQPPLECVFGEPLMEDYAPGEVESRSIGGRIHHRLSQRVFCPGRVLHVFKDGVFACSKAILFGLDKDKLQTAVLLPAELPEMDLSGEVIKLQDQSWVLLMAELEMLNVLHVSEQCLDIEAPTRQLGEELLNMPKLQPLVLSKAFKHVDSDFYDTLLRQRELLQRQEASKCHSCALKHRHFEQWRARCSLEAEIEDLNRELGCESLGLLPQLRAKEEVLKDLGCLDDEGLISLKGQAATEVLAADELAITEVVFQNVLENCSPAEAAAAISSFVFPDKVEEEEMEALPPNLTRIRSAILEQKYRVELLLQHHKVQLDSEELQRNCNIALMGTTYRWASGEQLASIMEDSPFQEGAIVRAIVRTEELLRKLQDVAKMLGSADLEKVFSDAADLIHRDIAFVPSLYIDSKQGGERLQGLSRS